MVKSRALIFDNVIVDLREHISATHLMKFVDEEFTFLHSSSNKQKIPSVLWSNTSGNGITSQIDESALKLWRMCLEIPRTCALLRKSIIGGCKPSKL